MVMVISWPIIGFSGLTVKVPEGLTLSILNIFEVFIASTLPATSVLLKQTFFWQTELAGQVMVPEVPVVKPEVSQVKPESMILYSVF